MCIRYISDSHLYDPTSLYWRESLGLSLEGYVEMFVDTWNDTCDKDDIIIHAGDVGIECRKTINALKALKGRILLVEGNHDKEWLRSNLQDCFLNVVPCLQAGNVFVQHIPTAGWLTTHYQVHGHHHVYHVAGMEQMRMEYLYDKTRLNCCADLNNHRPCTLLELQINKEDVRILD